MYIILPVILINTPNGRDRLGEKSNLILIRVEKIIFGLEKTYPVLNSYYVELVLSLVNSRLYE
jgi:hypothetical protein